MANRVISTTGSYTGYDAAVSIDATNDYMLLQQSSTYKKINRNTLLGLSSAPLGTTDSQSPTNKTFDNTNTFTIKDGSFTLQNTSSTTKQAVFSLASITAGQTRTITVPDASLTLVGTATTQTLTNKTLTSPTITGGTIANSTITVDSIAGYSSSTIVTVANLQISNGVLNSANAVTSTSVAAGAIQPQALVSGTGSGWAWSTWTPTLTNLSGGTQTTAKYIQTGKTVQFLFVYTLAGAGVSGAPTFTLPVTAAASASTGFESPVGFSSFVDAGTAIYYGPCWLSSTTVAGMYVWNAASTYLVPSAISSTVPFTFGNTDKIICTGTYEAA